jgi:hypothetical protein
LRWITAMMNTRKKWSIQFTWKIIPRQTIPRKTLRSTRRLAKRSTTGGTVTPFLPTSTLRSNINSSGVSSSIGQCKRASGSIGLI